MRKVSAVDICAASIRWSFSCSSLCLTSVDELAEGVYGDATIISRLAAKCQRQKSFAGYPRCTVDGILTARVRHRAALAKLRSESPFAYCLCFLKRLLSPSTAARAGVTQW